MECMYRQLGLDRENADTPRPDQAGGYAIEFRNTIPIAAPAAACRDKYFSSPGSTPTSIA